MKIMVGMSGGVDSSVAAALLKEQGHEVVGVTLDLLKENSENFDEDAKKVAEKLKIEHKTVDLKKEFYKSVVDYFAHEYISGRTPNPCIMCNRKIKFGLMLEYALKCGCDRLATGHYAKICRDNSKERWLLKKSESSKDQSYFLYLLTQHQLSHSLFPLEDFEKPQIRAIAQKYDLPVASKSESQDICFVKGVTPGKFVSDYLNQSFECGEFVGKNGKKLGVHLGIANYTVGQRKGLGISLGVPAYVTKILPGDNKVVLGEKAAGQFKEIIASNANFIPFEDLTQKIRARAKIRYRAPLVPCTAESLGGGRIKIIFDEKVGFPAPGQSVVLYGNKNEVIGGGIIEQNV